MEALVRMVNPALTEILERMETLDQTVNRGVWERLGSQGPRVLVVTLDNRVLRVYLVIQVPLDPKARWVVKDLKVPRVKLGSVVALEPWDSLDLQVPVAHLEDLEHKVPSVYQDHRAEQAQLDQAVLLVLMEALVLLVLKVLPVRQDLTDRQDQLVLLVLQDLPVIQDLKVNPDQTVKQELQVIQVHQVELA